MSMINIVDLGDDFTRCIFVSAFRFQTKSLYFFKLIQNYARISFYLSFINNLY